MAAQGTAFETPRACPFVALELDRDRRSDKPDYRHRCFAEPTPAPRSIAHQEAYCLSPNFAACPVFQDWAVRAAAQPSGGSGSSAAPGGPPTVGGTAATAAVDEDHDRADVEEETAPPAGESAVADLPEDASVTPAGAEIAAAAAAATGMAPGVASPPTFATTGWDDEVQEGQQLGAFDAQPSGHEEPAAAAAATAASSTIETPASAPTAGGAATPPSSPGEQAATDVPPFLAARSPRPLGSTIPSPAAQPRKSGPVGRDEIVPSWEIDGRYGAEPPPEPTGSRFDTVLTAVAVIAILAIGVAAVLFLPGLLSHSTPQHTPGPSILLPSIQPTAQPSALPSVAPSALPTVGPSVAPTVPASVGPVGTPRLYKIKPGDSLAKIANRFGVSVQDILDANPSITDPNHIEVGQTIVIPPAPAPAGT